MGRVSKYKKVKAVDPFSKQKKGKAASARTSEYVWGMGDNGRKEKKRSLKAQRHQARKLGGGSMSDGRRRAREAAGAGGFDLPPSGRDDFDLGDLMGSVKRQKRPRLDDGLADPRRRNEITVSKKSKSKGDGGAAASAAAQPAPSIPETDAEEKRVARILKLSSKDSKSSGGGGTGKGGPGSKSATGSSSTAKKDSKSQISGRREGESMRAFERRVKEETRLILLEQASESKLTSKEKAAKKKQFLKSLKSKKKNRKGGGGGRPRSGSSDDEYGSDGGYGDDGGDGFVTGERAVAAAARAAASTGAAIHDQVERPPTFELLPRGATKKAKKEGGKLGMDEQKRRAEQRAMDNLRAKVQAQYAVIKQKRKRAGDFHL